MLIVDEEIENLARLRELLPTEGFTNTFLKVSDQLNEVARRFIAAAPFIVVATKASAGMIDVSPKGDPAGFVEVYDDKTLIIPDRLGNHRVDGFQNILQAPNVAILFIVPGHGDTLRIAGKARIVKDRAISERLAVHGKAPLLAMVIEVQKRSCIAQSLLFGRASLATGHLASPQVSANIGGLGGRNGKARPVFD